MYNYHVSAGLQPRTTRHKTGGFAAQEITGCPIAYKKALIIKALLPMSSRALALWF
jgi:hypothetical protein